MKGDGQEETNQSVDSIQQRAKVSHPRVTATATLTTTTTRPIRQSGDDTHRVREANHAVSPPRKTTLTIATTLRQFKLLGR